ncbi:MAG TPA: ABC transporter ATP-binding protein [Bdellovibrionales bacterium]|nr:ABC transporter ATP-binding protein [Bdellovibrionales bacterium]
MRESLRRLWPYIRPFKRDVALTFLLGFGVSIFSALVPVLGNILIASYSAEDFEASWSKMPDWLAPHFPYSLENKSLVLTWLPYTFPVLFLCLGIFRVLNSTYLVYTTERIIGAVRMDLMRKLVRLNLNFHGSFERGSGGIISRVFSDTQLLQQGLGFYSELIQQPIQAMLYLSYMLWLDWQLTLVSLIFLPFFATITRQVSKSLRKYSAMGRDAMEDMTAVLKDTIDGVRVVQSFNLEGEMEGRFRSTLNHYLQTVKKVTLREVGVSPINEFAVSFLLMAFAIYSIDRTLEGTKTSADFVSFILAAGMLQAPIKKLQDVGVRIQQTVVITQRVFEILGSSKEVPQTQSPRPFPVGWQKIVFKDVSFSYGGETVLKNVNLTVKRGEMIALVGESGSGKSTLVNLLERFYDPTSGEILIDDVPITQLSLQELRHNVALVTQDVFLFRDSIARNIHAGDFQKSADGVENAAKLANAMSFIANTPKGFESPVGERGSFLSGGEKQRVSIARAIFKDAPILILDEATSALDSVSEMEVQKGLSHLLEHRTSLVIAHRFSTIFNANRIVVMKKGRIVEEGTHESLLAKQGEYHRFFELQMNHDERTRVST